MSVKKPTVFLESERVTLRPIDVETDLVRCQRWINDLETRHFLHNVWPISVEREKEFFAKESKDKFPTNITLAIVAKPSMRHIGNTGLHNIDWVSRRAETGTLIGEKRFRGRGYGSAAKMLLLRYAFIELNLRLITSSVMAPNKASLKCQQKCGYEIIGRFPRFLYGDGRYYDMIFLAITRSAWLKRFGS